MQGGFVGNRWYTIYQEYINVGEREGNLYNFLTNIQLNRAEDPFDKVSAEELQELARLAKEKEKTKRYRGIVIVDFVVNLNVKRGRLPMWMKM